MSQLVSPRSLTALRWEREPRVAAKPHAAQSGFQRDPAHLAARANRREPEALHAVGDAADLDRVVDPDVGAVGDDEPDRLLVERPALGLGDPGARLAQQIVDLRVLVPGRRLPGALELAVVHLAYPVLGVDE